MRVLYHFHLSQFSTPPLARKRACWHVCKSSFFTLSVVKEQSLFESLVRLEKNCSHYICGFRPADGHEPRLRETRTISLLHRLAFDSLRKERSCCVAQGEKRLAQPTFAVHWVSQFPCVGLKIPLSGSPNSLGWVSKFPLLGLKNPLA